MSQGKKRNLCFICVHRITGEPEVQHFSLAARHLKLNEAPLNSLFLPAICKFQNGQASAGRFTAFCFSCKSEIRVNCQLYEELCEVRLKLNLKIASLSRVLSILSTTISPDGSPWTGRLGMPKLWQGIFHPFYVIETPGNEVSM